MTLIKETTDRPNIEQVTIANRLPRASGNSLSIRAILDKIHNELVNVDQSGLVT